jgi:hypothetical protein
MTESSVGSSSEANLPVSSATMGKIEELNETNGNLDIEEAMDNLDLDKKDFTTRSGGVSSNVHQVCVIITEGAEENNDDDNLVVDTQAITQIAIVEKRRRKYTSPPGSGELSCQQLIMAQRYPQIQGEKS